MRPLPFDYARCKPQEPDDKCQNCRRWADHPQQTWGARKSFVVTVNSKDKACIQMPISLMGEGE
jgi:hypothetical protein